MKFGDDLQAEPNDRTDPEVAHGERGGLNPTHLIKSQEPDIPLQTHHVNSKLKRRRHVRFRFVPTWNTPGLFVGTLP